MCFRDSRNHTSDWEAPQMRQNHNYSCRNHYYTMPMTRKSRWGGSGNKSKKYGYSYGYGGYYGGHYGGHGGDGGGGCGGGDGGGGGGGGC
ncbi:uncharacterized protein BDV17DRAFT_272726 [Aspergillus undulatus]|uniref:uncharacterized protein n=1 Tax=Aspergillus undulatus TaxID=1810928 RepID=UPI003CCCFEE9